MLQLRDMDKVTFRPGDIILMDGLYGCSSGECEQQVWGTSGRRFLRMTCGHEEWRLIRRRIDNWW